jgi:hypothetical protein
MRKITRDIVNAFQNSRSLTIGNSRTNGESLWLFGNKIAEIRRDGLWITNAGWDSSTTKERLNGLSSVHIIQRRGKWYLNEVEWDGSWVHVDSFSRGVDVSIPEENVQEPEFDLTSEWIRSEGYSKPIYAVFHTIMEVSLEPVEAMLNVSGIPTRRMESDTEGVYRPNFFLVVRPEDVDNAVRILSESYCIA